MASLQVEDSPRAPAAGLAEPPRPESVLGPPCADAAACTVGAHRAGQTRGFQERQWVDWNDGHRERFAALCGERMEQVGYAVDWH